MQKILLFLLPFSLALAFSSCSMEKRLYRNGWYTEHSQKVSHSQSIPAASSETDENLLTDPPTTKPELRDTTIIIDPFAIKTDSSVKNHSKPFFIEEIEKKLGDDPEPKKKRMSYSDALASMSKAGCKPNKAASAIYWLAIISIICCWWGFGIIMAIVTLIMSIFAINKVAADGMCVEENIAIIKAGRRICWIMLLSIVVAAILITSIVLSILNMTNSL